jgi:long-chain fatty acid transport protein
MTHCLFKRARDKKVKKRLLTGAAVWAVVMALAVPAAANPADMFGMGNSNRGMGNAATGIVSGANAAYYNPAFLTFMERPELEVGWVGAYMQLQTNGNDLDTQTHNAVEFSIGGPLPGKLKFLGLGVSTYVPLSGFARIYVQAPVDPQYLMYRNLGRFAIYPGAAVRIGEYVSLGLGANVFVSNYGQVGFKVDFGSGIATHRNYIQGLSITLAPTAGFAFKWKDLASFGISYRGSTQMTISNFQMDFDAGLLDMPMTMNGAIFYTPHQISFGVGYKPIKMLQLAADITWAMWHYAPDMSVRVDVKPSQLLPPITSPIASVGFSDIVIPRIGIEVVPIEALKLRAGYYWYPTPAPTPVYDTNIIDTDRHVLSLGIGYTFKDPQNIIEGIGLDGSFQYQFLVPRTVIKKSLVDPIGDYGINGGVVVGGISLRIIL